MLLTVLLSIGLPIVAMLHRHAPNDMWDGTRALNIFGHSASTGVIFAINAHAAFVSAPCKSDQGVWVFFLLLGGLCGHLFFRDWTLCGKGGTRHELMTAHYSSRSKILV